jgi:hypothetical protein
LPETTVDAPFRTPLILERTTPSDSPQFYVRMGYVCAFVAVVGFIPTYWAPVASASFGGPPLLHLHGLLFSAWPLLFIVQARLALSGRLERHRVLGYVGISLVTAMLFAGTAVAIDGLRTNLAAGFESARAFTIVPLSILLSFVGLVVAAIANVRRPEVHMRLMMAATVTLLPPAIARILFFLISPEGVAAPGQGEPPTVAFALLPSFLANGLIALALARDWRRVGRPHPAYLWSAACLVAMQLGRIPVSRTVMWHGFTSWLLTIAG